MVASTLIQCLTNGVGIVKRITQGIRLDVTVWRANGT
jgi:hypothetical protein